MEKTSFLRGIKGVKDVFLRVPPVLLLPLGAVLSALCLLYPGIGFIGWLAMVPALYFLFSRIERSDLRYRRAYGMGFLYFYVFYLVVWHWFVDLYPMEFAGVTKGEAILLIAICWLGLSLLQALLSALALPVLLLLSRTRLLKKRPALLPLLFASVYTVAEWAQTLTWAGVPWARLALGQSACGVLFGGAALFGSYFITFSIVAVNGFAAYAMLHLDRVRFCAVCCAATFLFALGAGMIGYFTAPTGGENGVIVAAVQGNVGSSEKWTSTSNIRSYEVYEKYTAEAKAKGARMVVFPETFMPYRINESSTLGMYVRGLAKKYEITIRCGAFYYDEKGEKLHNGLFTVYPDGSIDEVVYAKRRLVPFGEFVPMRPIVETLVPPLADMGMLSEDLDAGTDSALVNTEIGMVGSLICFDSIYEGLTLDAVRDGAEVICLSTNDSWFLDSIGIYMHHRQAQLRAVESGRYIIRSADTGISSVISPNGRAEAELPPLVDGVSVATVYPTAQRTLYSYIGNAIVYLMVAAELALAADGLICYLRRRGKGKDTQERMEVSA